MRNVLPSAKPLLADRGYDADGFRKDLINKGLEPWIPPRIWQNAL